MSAADLVQRVWLSTNEAATYTGRHFKTVRDAATCGELQSTQRKPGGPRFYRAEWLDSWMMSRPSRRAS